MSSIRMHKPSSMLNDVWLENSTNSAKSISVLMSLYAGNATKPMPKKKRVKKKVLNGQ